MRITHPQKQSKLALDYTNDSFIRKQPRLDYEAQAEQNQFHFLVQQNRYLKKLACKFAVLLTSHLKTQFPDKQNSIQSRDQVKHAVETWKASLAESKPMQDHNSLSQEQTLEVIHWLGAKNLSAEEQVLELERQLQESEAQKEKYLKSLESVRASVKIQTRMDGDFDPHFFQRKLDQLKRQVGCLIRLA